MHADIASKQNTSVKMEQERQDLSDTTAKIVAVLSRLTTATTPINPEKIVGMAMNGFEVEIQGECCKLV